MARIVLASRAARELRKLDPPTRTRIVAGLRDLAGDVDNLDVRPLSGAAPWLRLRVGDYRILYRYADEAAVLVARIVHRSDLERAVQSL